jgi:hypothetical protein
VRLDLRLTTKSSPRQKPILLAFASCRFYNENSFSPVSSPALECQFFPPLSVASINLHGARDIAMKSGNRHANEGLDSAKPNRPPNSDPQVTDLLFDVLENGTDEQIAEAFSEHFPTLATLPGR